MPGVSGQILHAGSGRQQTVREMVETIIDVCGQRQGMAQFGGEPARPDEPVTWVAGIDRTVELTGWRPRHDLRSGIEHTWAWRRRLRQGLAA